MARHNLSYLNRDYPIETAELSPFENVVKRKTMEDFKEFLISSENNKLDRRIRQLEQEGVITVYWDKLDNSYKPAYEEPVEMGSIAKSFIIGVCVGIGFMIII